jgi:hypothetical protein
MGDIRKKEPPGQRRAGGPRPKEVCSPNGPQPKYTHRTPEVLPEESPHGCYEGWIHLGFEGEDENGEHVEEIESAPCRRCRVAENL